MNKKLVAIAITAFMLCSSSIVAYANPLITESKLKENRENLASLKKQVDDLETHIFALNDEISIVRKTIEENNKEITLLEEKISETEKNMLKAEETLEQKRSLYSNRLRHLYKNKGDTSYLATLMSAANLTDFLARLHAIGTIIHLDNQMIEELITSNKELERYLTSIENQSKELKILKQDNENKLLTLESKKEEQQLSLNSISHKLKELEDLIASQEKTILQKEASDRQDDRIPKDINEDGLISLGVFKLTAYCPCSKCCGPNAKGITATGTKARANHTISVDPSIIPFRTAVIINGQVYVAEDRGGGVKKYHIDIFFDSHRQALDFGVKYREVFIRNN